MNNPSNPETFERARRLGAGLIWSQVGRIFDIGLGLLFSVLVVRILGPQDYAIYAVAWSIVNVAALLASLGYGEILTRFLPEFEIRDQGQAASFVRRLLLERLLVSLVVGAGIWIAVLPLGEWTHTSALPQVIGLVLALAIAQGVSEILVGYYTATLRMRDQAGVRAATQSANLVIAIALFQLYGIHIWVPLVAQLAGNVLSIGLYLYGAHFDLRRAGELPDLAPIRRFGAYVWLTNLATFGLASQIDVLLIAVLLTNQAQVSYYNVAALLLARLYALLMGWTAVLMPSAAEARAQDGTSGIARSFDRYIKINLAIMLPPLLFVVAWSEALISLFFGPALLAAATPLRVFAFFGLLSALAGANICHPLLYVADRQRSLMWLRIAAGGLNVILDLLLIPPFGAVGAVLGTSMSNLATHIIELGMLRQLTNLSYPVSVAFKLLLMLALACLPALFMPLAELSSLIGGAVLFGIIFLIGIRFMHPLSHADYSTLSKVVPPLRPVLEWFD